MSPFTRHLGTLLGATLAGFAFGAAPAVAQVRTLPRSEVAVVQGADGMLLHVEANQVPFSSLISKIGLAAGRTVEGLQQVGRDPEITAMLEGAELRDALLVISGSVGLRATLKGDSILVTEDVGPYPTRQELFTRSDAWYLRALRNHPESVLAPGALWNRATMLDDDPGRSLAAAEEFETLAEEHPDSDLAAQALIEASRAYGEAAAWTEACTCLERTLAMSTPKQERDLARRLLADALTHVADSTSNPSRRQETAERALLQLDVLATEDEPISTSERRRRYIVRSRALSLTGQADEALRYLDLAQKNGADPTRDPEVSELRAHAFEFSGQYERAVRAWLMYAEQLEGPAQGDALRRAALAAERGGAHLSAITITKLAEERGLATAALQSVENQAWTALDFEAKHLDVLGDTEQVARAARLMERGMPEEAAAALRPVFDRRMALPLTERLELGLTYATALAESDQLASAVFVLRKSAQEQTHPTERRKVYLAASEILERAGEIDLAIEALKGRL